MLGNAVQEAQRTMALRSSLLRAMTTEEPVEYPAAYPGVLSVGATDTQGGGFCSFSNRGEGLRLLAPGCDLDGAEPTTGAPNYNYWQGTSEASAIAAAALDALDSYQPGLSPEAAEKDLTEADNGVLDIAQTFRNAGLGAIVTAGEAAEPGAQSNSTPGSSPQPVTPLAAMTLTRPFGRPQARLRRVKHRLVLALTGTPQRSSGAGALPRPQGTIAPLRVLRTLHGVFTSLTLPTSGASRYRCAIPTPTTWNEQARGRRFGYQHP